MLSFSELSRLPLRGMSSSESGSDEEEASVRGMYGGGGRRGGAAKNAEQLEALERRTCDLERENKELRRVVEILGDAVETLVVASVTHKPDENALLYAPKELKGDRDFVLATVSQNGLALKHGKHATGTQAKAWDKLAASWRKRGGGRAVRLEDWTQDRQVVLAAVMQNGLALQYAALSTRNRGAYGGRAVQPENWKQDRQVVLAAVSQNGLALQYAAPSLKGDQDLVLVAVSQNGRALEHAAAELQCDPLLSQLQALNLRLSLPLLAAHLRLCLAHVCTCEEWLDNAYTAAHVPSEVTELIGQHCTIGLVALGLVVRSQPPTLSESVPPTGTGESSLV